MREDNRANVATLYLYHIKVVVNLVKDTWKFFVLSNFSVSQKLFHKKIVLKI